MSGFIANGTAGNEATIENDGFWPSIEPAELRARIRLDGTVAEPRLRAAIIAAVLTANDELATWKARQLAAGHATLFRSQGARENVFAPLDPLKLIQRQRRE